MSAVAATAAVLIGAYAGAVAVLIAAGRRSDARAVAGFVPDCAGMFRRLLAGPGTNAWERAGLVMLVAYLVSPIDLVPDFIPVVGQLDDAILVTLALAYVLRKHGEGGIREAWRGPESSLRLVLRAAATL